MDRVSCWGLDTNQLCRVTTSRTKRYPGAVRVSQNGPPLEGIVEISAGSNHTCALTSKEKYGAGGGVLWDNWETALPVVTTMLIAFIPSLCEIAPERRDNSS